MESELGVPFEDVYELVEPEPIAAASIGQVGGSVFHHMGVPDIGEVSCLCCCASALRWFAQYRALWL